MGERERFGREQVGGGVVKSTRCWGCVCGVSGEACERGERGRAVFWIGGVLGDIVFGVCAFERIGVRLGVSGGDGEWSWGIDLLSGETDLLSGEIDLWFGEIDL